MNELREDAIVKVQMPTPAVLSLGEINGQSKMISNGGNMVGLTKNDALTYLRSVRDFFQDEPEKYRTFTGLMREFNTKRIDTNGVIANVKELFKDCKNLLQGFNVFLPKGYSITLLPEEENSESQVERRKAMEFISKIKASFGGDSHAFLRFVDLLNMHNDKVKSVPEVSEEVTILFKDHQDLLMEFNKFLPKGFGLASPCSPCSGRNPVSSDKGFASPAMHPDKKIKIRCRLKDSSESSLQREECDANLVVCSTGNSMENPIVKEDQPAFLNAEYNQGIHYCENKEDNKRDIDRNKDTGNDEIPLSTTKNVAVPINELDFSAFPRCTPSYRILPKNFPDAISEHRTSLGHEVLNDHCVSGTSGSEDHSFKHMSKNQYEEILFHCEDDRYEMDMLIESVESAIKHVEILLKKINNKTISIDTPIDIEEHLTIMNQRCIERLYGDYGLQVMEDLKKNTHVVLPLILTRLKQKKEEWSSCHSEYKKVWAEVYATNHQKSLDYHSRCFKQKDSQNFSSKGLLAEIKDISEKKCQEDDQLHAFGVGNGIVPSFIPDLKFRYSDTQIHDDLYELIKYCCEELYTAEQSDKIMKLWTTFLEPMFGIPSRSQGNQELHDDATITNEVIQSSKQISPGNDHILEDVDNHRFNEALVVQHDDELEEGEITPTVSEQFLQTVKPVSEHLSLTLQANETCSQKDSRIFYGNESYYVLFRLHQVLYKKIQSAKKLSKKKGKALDKTAPESYVRFMNALYNLLNGSINNSKFEDECRANFGANSYVLFTLDKLIQKFVNLLHKIAANEKDKKLRKLYAYENYRKPGRFIDLVYHENVRAFLHETDIYRFKYSSPESCLSIQLKNSVKDQAEVKSVTLEPTFVHYLYNDFLSSVSDEEKPGLYLKRNKKKFTESSKMPLALKGLKVINKLGYKMDCSSYKVNYVANTADVLYRSKRRKLNPESKISKQRRKSLFYTMLYCRFIAS